jgi:epoxyqueuosine reductase
VSAFQAAYSYPELLPVAEAKKKSAPERFSEELKRYALAHEADDIGIAVMDPLYVFDGYTIEEPSVVVLALTHNYELLKEVPSDETNGIGVRKAFIRLYAVGKEP